MQRHDLGQQSGPACATPGAGVNLLALAALTVMIVVASAVGVRVFRWE